MATKHLETLQERIISAHFEKCSDAPTDNFYKCLIDTTKCFRPQNGKKKIKFGEPHQNSTSRIFQDELSSLFIKCGKRCQITPSVHPAQHRTGHGQQRTSRAVDQIRFFKTELRKIANAEACWLRQRIGNTRMPSREKPNRLPSG